ncbi:MAG TPA: histidine kinase dimerization/phospho-acceptor domain-containing protein, partial [bacterium]|nr:histidine kinase dimerization/phospho-acceptor domain-containing protein [bacterium]
MIKSVITYCGLTFLFVFGAAIYSQNMVKGLPVIEHYAPQTYGAGVDNFCFVQDKRGFIYVANGSGVLEYDGIQWRLIPLENRAAASWLTISPEGTIFVASLGEFGCLVPDSSGFLKYQSLVNRQTHPQLKFQTFWEMCASSQATYLRSYRHLVRYKNGNIKVWSADGDGFDIMGMVYDTIYTRIKHETIVRIIGDSLVPLPGGDFFKEIKINGFLPYQKNKLLIATRKDGLFIYEAGQIKSLKTEADDYLKKYFVYDTRQLPDGGYVIATLQGGVVLFDADLRVKQIIDETSGLPANGVNSVFVDNNFNLWLGHSYHGITRIEIHTPLTLLNASTGINGRVKRMLRHKGTLYVMTNSGLFRLTEKGNAYHFELLHSGAPYYFDMFVTQGRLLISTGSGILEVKNDNVVSHTSVYTYAVLNSNRDSNIVYASEGLGMTIYRVGKSEKWELVKTIPSVKVAVRTMAYDEYGDLWLGTEYEGLGRMQINKKDHLPDTVEFFDSKFGLPAGEISVWSTGAAPLFSGHDGFYKFSRQYHRFNKLSETEMAMHRDNSEYWIGLNQGRWMITPTALQIMPEKTIINRLRAIKNAVDFIYWRDSDGTEWYGGDFLIVKHKPKTQTLLPERPTVVLRRVMQGLEVIFSDDEIKRNHQIVFESEPTQPIRFEFTAPVFEMRPQFQTRIIGLNEQWESWGSDPVRLYERIPAGKYRFEVRARDHFGRISEITGADFVVNPPWYLARTMLMLFALVAIALVWLFIRYREHRLKQMNQELERLVEDRTRALKAKEAQLIQSEKMAALGQMVGGVMHEINNPLTFIQPNLEYVQINLKKFIADIASKTTTENRQIEIHEFERDTINALKSSIKGAERIRDIVISLKSFSAYGKNQMMDVHLDHQLSGAVDLFFNQNKDIRFIRSFEDTRFVRIDTMEMMQCV